MIHLFEFQKVPLVPFRDCFGTRAVLEGVQLPFASGNMVRAVMRADVRCTETTVLELEWDP